MLKFISQYNNYLGEEDQNKMKNDPRFTLLPKFQQYMYNVKDEQNIIADYSEDMLSETKEAFLFSDIIAMETEYMEDEIKYNGEFNTFEKGYKLNVKNYSAACFDNFSGYIDDMINTEEQHQQEIYNSDNFEETFKEFVNNNVLLNLSIELEELINNGYIVYNEGMTVDFENEQIKEIILHHMF
jgi:hypothetical protein